MKIFSTALVAAGLASLSACGGGAENAAANNVAEEVNVEADDLGGDNGLLNVETGNEASDANAGAATDNAAGNDQ